MGNILTIEDAISRIDAILHHAKSQGLDPELILAHVYADHLMSNGQHDSCHMYGISFAEKLNSLMEKKDV